jgi:hypothetical protein
MIAMPLAEAGSHGLISLAAYGAIIRAMQASAMGAVSALRETSVLFAALLDAIFLGERLTGWQIAACCIIAIGAACVGWRFEFRRQRKTPRREPRRFVKMPVRGTLKASIFLEEAGKLLLEPRYAAAAVEQLLGAADPGRVRLGVDIEVQLVALLAPGRARLVLGTIGHYDRNHMIIRVNFGFHGRSFGAPAPVFSIAWGADLDRSITQASPQNKPGMFPDR